jgi:hypothetical protein
MLKKLRLPILALSAALILLSPTAGFARDHHREWREHHHHVRVYVGPAYPYGYYGYYGYHRGHYDAWGYWHPY